MVNIRRTFYVLLVLCVSISMHSQSIVFGNVQDAFLKIPLPEAKVSLLRAADSAVVVESIPVTPVRREDGTVSKAQFILRPEKKSCAYLLRAMLDGYEDCWLPLTIDGSNDGAVLLEEALELRRQRQVNLDEVVVKATKVKMYYKGDTLVYNADAFKLPEGSMLDDLIRQMPGVTMNDEGEIFVNGRKVEELLLGSRTFMQGNSKVLLENLPYYTVKDIKVYEKKSDMSEALGFDVEPRKYVMDVNLKKEYSIGYIANVEAAAGTKERWLGRGFLLGFTNRWRYSLQSNVNNVNESRHISADGHWTPSAMPKSLVTTRSVAANMNYQSADNKLKDNINVSFASSSTESRMKRHSEQFFNGSTPVSFTDNSNESDSWNLALDNELRLLKPSYLQCNTNLYYEKRNASGLTLFEQGNDGSIASMRTDALSDGRKWRVYQLALGAYGKEQWRTHYSFKFYHDDDQSWLSDRYDSWQAAGDVCNVRRNARDVSSKVTDVSLGNGWLFSKLFGKVGMRVNGGIHYMQHKSHDYLYHPDTLLLASQIDVLKAITDASNSYDSNQREWTNTVEMALFRPAASGYVAYNRWYAGVDVKSLHRKLDYKRGVIDTLMRNTKVYFKPHISFESISSDIRRRAKLEISHECSPADMVDMIAFRDDSNPLVVKEGNSQLKGHSVTRATADYTCPFGAHASQWHVAASFSYNHRGVAQSVRYSPVSGIFTYKPVNVSGAYNGKADFDISSHIGDKRYWTWQMQAGVAYNHSLDHAMLDGETESHVNVVNTINMHDGAYIQYSKDAVNVRATVDVKQRHSEGKMQSFKTLDATDLQYGLSGRYTLPMLNTTVSASANMYSRRGYGASSMNTDDFVLNASVSQPFMKGKLIARVEAFDVLHQLSSTQYEVNAQGRTETWYRSLPNYVMLHVVYHWNKNPNKKK